MIELSMSACATNRLITQASAETVALDGDGVRFYRAVRYAETPDTTYLRAVDEAAAARMPVAGRVRVGDRIAVDRRPYLVERLPRPQEAVVVLAPQ